jgi:hypothetical protein
MDKSAFPLRRSSDPLFCPLILDRAMSHRHRAADGEYALFPCRVNAPVSLVIHELEGICRTLDEQRSISSEYFPRRICIVDRTRFRIVREFGSSRMKV